MTLDGEIVDLFDGLADLSAGVIRAVGQAEVRFTEDALRMMRALRFSAQLGFQIAPETRKALQRLAPNLEKIAVERIRVEFEKLMMGKNAAISLAMAVDDRVIDYLPGKLGQWELTRMIADLTAQQPATLPVVWAHVLTRSELTPSDMIRFMRTWKTSREVLKAATTVAPVARAITTSDQWTLYQVYPFREILLRVLSLIRTDDEVIAKVTAVFADLPIHQSSDLTIDGGALIAAQITQPGPQMGRILNQIERSVVAGRVPNNKSSLLTYAKELSQHDQN